MTTEDIDRIRGLRYGDGLTSAQTAAIIGRCVSTVERHAPGRPGKIDNSLLRMAFIASGRSAVGVARSLDWTYSRGPGRVDRGYDGARVKRTLGIMPSIAGHGGRQLRKLIDAETAGLIAEAIGVAPWEIMPDEEAA